MLRIREVTLPLGYTDADMRRAAARILKISEKRLETVRIFRRSVDARHRDRVSFSLALDVSIRGDEELALQRSGGMAVRVTEAPYLPPSPARRPSCRRWWWERARRVCLRRWCWPAQVGRLFCWNGAVTWTGAGRMWNGSAGQGSFFPIPTCSSVKEVQGLFPTAS